jgi:hypothetical protein
MNIIRNNRPNALLVACLMLLGGGLLVGCRSGGTMSGEDLQEIQQGPPKEMPPEARQVFEQAMRRPVNNAPQSTPR